jgi:hypothetical protein
VRGQGLFLAHDLGNAGFWKIHFLLLLGQRFMRRASASLFPTDCRRDHSPHFF